MSTFEIAAENRVVVVRLRGRANLETVIALLREVVSLAERRNALRVLLDESCLQPGLVTPAGIRRLAGEWRNGQGAHAARLAVLAPQPVIYRLNRLAQRLGGEEAERTIGVFRRRAEALDWLAAEA